MRKVFIHNPFFRLLAPLVFGVIVYLLILLVGNNLNDISQIFSNEELYVCIGVTYLTFESLRASISLIKRFQFSHIRNQIVLTVAISVLISIAVITLSIVVYYKWRVGFDVGVREL